jgi:putative transposase
MDDIQRSAHIRWECKYHAVWISKYRRYTLYRQPHTHLGPVLRELARRRECMAEEGHLNLDHVHMLLSIPPNYAVAQVLGLIKGKSEIRIVRTCLGRRQSCAVQRSWSRGDYVSTAGCDAAVIRK